MEETNKKKRSISKYVMMVLVLVVIGSSLATAYYYKKYQEAKILVDNPEQIAKNESKSVMDKLSKLMEVPADEEPSIATVLDVEKLKEQPFFAKAQNGDKVIIFSKAQMAILYRAEINKIVNFSNISVDAKQQGVQEEALGEKKIEEKKAEVAPTKVVATPTGEVAGEKTGE